MKPNSAFLNQPSEFWALVRGISESLGYSQRKTKEVRQSLRKYHSDEITLFAKPFFVPETITKKAGEYLDCRASLLSDKIHPLLMDRTEAKRAFKGLLAKYKPKCPLPMNKQKGEKRHYAYLTCMVNVLTERSLKKGKFCNYSPRALCTITDASNKLVKVLSRWMDGVYPDVKNPAAVWEVKEYYGTTTFGSRVADGVYETQLDGYELLEAERVSGRKIQHYLFVDDRFTWWDCGRSYLCRLVDMMHMGLVDEIVFGKEVLTRWPEIIRSWP